MTPQPYKTPQQAFGAYLPPVGHWVTVTQQSGQITLAKLSHKPSIFRGENVIDWVDRDDRFVSGTFDPVIEWNETRAKENANGEGRIRSRSDREIQEGS